MSLSIKRYTSDFYIAWNEFVKASKNATFLHHRNFMEYHQDRFTDHSLLFYENEKLIALFPASEHDKEIRSHGGLTYGGILSNQKMSAPLMLEVINTLTSYYADQGYASLLYKVIPHIYHQHPAEEDIYGLFRADASLIRVDNSTAIASYKRLPLSNLKKRNLKKIEKYSISIKTTEEFSEFSHLLSRNLKTRHDTIPTHTEQELVLLSQRFPENIKLHAAYEDGEMIAATLIFITDRVAHTQYLTTSERGREIAALDYLLHNLITQTYAHLPYFDFGISNEDQGRVLNEGLCRQKEMFGGRSIAHLFFRIEL